MSKEIKEADMGSMAWCETVSKTNLCPAQYKGKPAEIMIACQMGKDLGLTPFQSIQNIAVINGKASIYGDALISMCRKHPEFEDIKEYFEGDQQNRTAVCEVKRNGQSWYKSTFSKKDAATAGLLDKPGPWRTYPDRMLKLRARGFALRDVFADAFGGVISREEAEDYPKNNERKVVNPMDSIEKIETPVIDHIDQQETPQNEPSTAPNEDVLGEEDMDVYTVFKINGKSDKVKGHVRYANEMIDILNAIYHSHKSKDQKVGFLNKIFEINDEGLTRLMDGNGLAHDNLSKLQQRYIVELDQ
tara:strand:- start:1516 stop:2421 length:906 start_codon:yes stop_codon:yes gene_type:complete